MTTPVASVVKIWCASASILLAAAVSIASETEDAHFHFLSLARFSAESPCSHRIPTHAETAGIVRYTRHEADGDWHIRLCASADPGKCVVLECIPALPCKLPAKGAHVTARGITRYDAAPGHGWWELNPVLSITEDE